MKMKKILLVAAVVLVIVVVAVFAFMAAIIMDMGSLLAGGSETLSPSGNLTGHALVVYDPGFSGGAKGIADTIANDLKADGYTVTLAGVKSSAASDVSSYDVIVVGGPVYMSNASGSIKAYLQGLHPAAGAKVGVFGFGGTAIDYNDQDAVMNDVVSVTGTTLKIDTAIKLTGDSDKSQMCAEFIADLLE